MHRLTSIPLLAPVAALCLGVLLVEGWWLQRAQGESVRELRALELLKQERYWLAHQAPSLSAENEAALTAEVAAVGRVLDEFKQALAGNDLGAPAAPPPAGSTEAYFELADFIRQLRAGAAQAQVVLKRDEFFGFASHANAGPVAEQVAAVHRQRLATEYLVGRLLESRPLALLAVRRERPVGNTPRDHRDRADDFFELEAPLSVRRPDEVAGEACQLEFTGQTAALRNFLNALAAGRQPVVVRGVQVEPMAVTVAASTHGALAPLVGPVVSKFTVSVEIVRLADNPGTTAP